MASANKTQDHGEIRKWVESKNGHPATVKGREGLLRVDFGEKDDEEDGKKHKRSKAA